MKLPALFIIALVLAMVAVGAWLWLAGIPAPTANVRDATSSPEITRPEALSVPADRPAAHALTVGSESSPLATPPAEPIRIASSVVPGIPVGRGPRSVPRPPAIVLPPGVRGSNARPDPQAEAKSDLENVQSMIRDFRTRLGGNPEGSNAEIMRSVMGGNSAKATLGPPAGQGLNDDGELVDRWGAPYFFHQLSKTSMELRSAGPDRTMYTVDDLVTK